MKTNDELMKLYRRTLEAIQPLAELEAKAKQMAQDVIDEVFPQNLRDDLKALRQIQEEHEAEMKSRILAGAKLPGTHTTTRKTAVIDEAAAIAWAKASGREGWVQPETLTSEARKAIEKAVTDRLHPLAGLIPDEVARYVEKKSPVISEKKILDKGE